MSWRSNQVMQLLSESIPGLVAFQLETAMVLDVCPGDPELFHVGFHKRWLLPPQRTQQRFVHPDILIRVRILTSRHDSKRHWAERFFGSHPKNRSWVVVPNMWYFHPYLGVSLNGGTPKHPKMIIFSRKTHGCWVPPF